MHHPPSDTDPTRDAEALRRRTRELAILNAVAESLNASVDLPQSLGAALSRVAELLGLRTGWVWLLDEVTEEPYLAAASHLAMLFAIAHPELVLDAYAEAGR